jgi:hypothetical protein
LQRKAQLNHPPLFIISPLAISTPMPYFRFKVILHPLILARASCHAPKID